MKILRDKAQMRAWSRKVHGAGDTLAFVPTMGALHEGHLSLVRTARARADIVVASIYVNPTQFAPGEDFGVYPRDEAADLAALEAEGVNAVFCPTDLYKRHPRDAPEWAAGQPDQMAWVEVHRLTDHLCGRSRPGFFRGVATVVTKLFGIVQPDVAVFGHKDFQQLLVIRRLVHDLDLGIEIIGSPIVREDDGLAMSSRNARLTPEDRARATSLSRALAVAEHMYNQGERDADTLRARMLALIEYEGGRVDYVEVADRETLEPLTAATGHIAGPALAALAVQFGDVRLIDNRDLG